MPVFHASFPTPREEGVETEAGWYDQEPVKAGGSVGDRTGTQSRTCILSPTSDLATLSSTPWWLPDRAPNIPNSGCRNQTRNQHREGLTWPGREGPAGAAVAAAWQTRLPPPAAASLGSSAEAATTPGPSGPPSLQAGHMHTGLAAGGRLWALAPTQAQSSWPAPVLSAWPQGL